MREHQEKLSHYEQLLPRSVRVEVHQEEDGSFWAKVLDFENCLTQGRNFRDLLEMISEAIYVSLDIPEELHAFLPRYVPQEIKDELERKKWQDGFEKFISDQIRGERELEFTPA